MRAYMSHIYSRKTGLCALSTRHVQTIAHLTLSEQSQGAHKHYLAPTQRPTTSWRVVATAHKHPLPSASIYTKWLRKYIDGVHPTQTANTQCTKPSGCAWAHERRHITPSASCATPQNASPTSRPRMHGCLSTIVDRAWWPDTWSSPLTVARLG